MSFMGCPFLEGWLVWDFNLARCAADSPFGFASVRMTKSKIQTKGQGCLIMWRQPENGEWLWAGGVTWRQAVAASRRDKEQILPEWRMLHGVQGLALLVAGGETPARAENQRWAA